MTSAAVDHRGNTLLPRVTHPMLPDKKLGSKNSANSAWMLPPERRPVAPRTVVSGEILIAWPHASEAPLRYAILDVSEGGVRIQSLLPLREGMTGLAISLLPEGKALNRKFQLMWCRRSSSSANLYEAGLRFND